MTGPDIEARELTEREARRALREQFDLPPDFEDTSPGWEIEPTEEQAMNERETEGWKEAAIAWSVCASIHETWAKGKDALYKTRHADFVRHADDARARALATPPSAPTAVEPDERAMANELVKVAAWLLSPEPRRKLAELEDATHIGHRQFHRAYEGTFETLRLKAIEIRNFVDAARESKGTPK